VVAQTMRTPPSCFISAALVSGRQPGPDRLPRFGFSVFAIDHRGFGR
jgi:hypothetical protein